MSLLNLCGALTPKNCITYLHLKRPLYLDFFILTEWINTFARRGNYPTIKRMHIIIRNVQQMINCILRPKWFLKNIMSCFMVCFFFNLQFYYTNYLQIKKNNNIMLHDVV